MANVIRQLGLFSDGDTFCIDLTGIYAVKNNGPGIATNVVVTITVPPGLIYVPSGSTVTHGVFDELTSTWTIGSLLNNESAEGSFCFEVADACLHPYEIVFDVTYKPVVQPRGLLPIRA